MRSMSSVVVALSLAFGALVPTAGTAAASGEYQCMDQALGPVVIASNLVVPSGAYCDLFGTHVTGNVSVKPTGGLLAEGATIDGDVHVDRDGQFAGFDGTSLGKNLVCAQCAFADLQDSALKGNLEDNKLSQGAFLENSVIGGQLNIHDSLGDDVGFNIDGNTIGDSLNFDKNTGSSDISGNTITRNLDCKGNTPPPTGAGNTARKKSGQCAAL